MPFDKSENPGSEPYEEASAFDAGDKKYAKRTTSDADEMPRSEGIQQAAPSGLEGNPLACFKFCCID